MMETKQSKFKQAAHAPKSEGKKHRRTDSESGTHMKVENGLAGMEQREN